MIFFFAFFFLGFGVTCGTLPFNTTTEGGTDEELKSVLSSLPLPLFSRKLNSSTGWINYLWNNDSNQSVPGPNKESEEWATIYNFPTKIQFPPKKSEATGEKRKKKKENRLTFLFLLFPHFPHWKRDRKEERGEKEKWAIKTPIPQSR